MKIKTFPLQFTISTHALREEGDAKGCSLPGPPSNFYPRPPRGGRRRLIRLPKVSGLFLPTPSARRATEFFLADQCAEKFLPTPSARRATPCAAARGLTASNFYPRPPRGGRLAAPVGVIHDVAISTHALREEGDRMDWIADEGSFISTHALREEGDLIHQDEVAAGLISTHALREEGDQFSQHIRGILGISTHALREEGDIRF